jgi:hypothetical protein
MSGLCLLMLTSGSHVLSHKPLLSTLDKYSTCIRIRSELRRITRPLLSPSWPGGNFASDNGHAVLGRCLACNFAQRILLQTRIQNSIGYLVSQFVWVARIDRLRRKQKGALKPSFLQRRIFAMIGDVSSGPVYLAASLQGVAFKGSAC